MKNVFRTLVLAGMVAVSGVTLASCGNSSAGTYTCTVNATDISGNSVHSAFLAEGVPAQTNTLVLNSDNTYSLTKHLECGTADGAPVKINLEFMGTYEYAKTEVTLSVPSDVKWDIDWGSFIEKGLFPGVLTGQLSKGDKEIKCGRVKLLTYENDGGHNPTYFFLTPYFFDSETTGEVKVELDKKTESFTYVVVEEDE